MAIITHPQGNMLTLSIPMEIRYITYVDGKKSIDVVKFNPSSDVMVSLVKGTSRQKVKARVTGNRALAEFDNTLEKGVYALVVTTADDDNRPLEYKASNAVEITETALEAGMPDNVEFTSGVENVGAAIFPGYVVWVEVNENSGTDAARLRDTRPIVHRCIPFKPQVGETYHFVRTVMVKVSSRYDMGQGTVDLAGEFARRVLVSCFNMSTHELSQVDYMASLEVDPAEISRENPIIMIYEVSRREDVSVTITKEMLNQYGQLDIPKMIEACRVGKKRTTATRSPYFTINRGEAECVADISARYVHDTLLLHKSWGLHYEEGVGTEARIYSIAVMNDKNTAEVELEPVGMFPRNWISVGDIVRLNLPAVIETARACIWAIVKEVKYIVEFPSRRIVIIRMFESEKENSDFITTGIVGSMAIVMKKEECCDPQKIKDCEKLGKRLIIAMNKPTYGDNGNGRKLTRLNIAENPFPRSYRGRFVCSRIVRKNYKSKVARPMRLRFNKEKPAVIAAVRVSGI